MNDRIQIKKVETLSDDWYILKKTTFDYRRDDGSWQTLTRETYDRGNGATILLYNRARKTVVLTGQFRFPAYVNGHHGMLIEACAGLLDEDDAEACIRRETEEETGYQIGVVKKVFEAYMSPGSVTEKLFFFVGEYEPESKSHNGGGLETDGEDIGVLELPFERAMAMLVTGEIVDGKTIMLLQYAQITHLLD
jgi:nudix-type nucleoside diphosphatase (YffH/AdpP family)